MPKPILFSLLAMTLLVATAVPAADVPEPGSPFPQIEIPAPDSEEDRTYLGIDGETFLLGDIEAEIVVLEIIGVYCPQCHRQAPLFNQLANRLHRSSATSGRVKMVALASGATPMEMEFLEDKFRAPYPLVYETDFSIHQKLGEPKTPFTLIIQLPHKVVETHLGVIEDIDSLYTSIVQHLP